MLHLGRHVTHKNISCRSINLRRAHYLTKDLVGELHQRELVADITRPGELTKALETRQTVYAGIDPTAQALHVGHLLPLLCLLHFQIRGHSIITLIGGATGLVGDPSGRTAERPLAQQAKVELNTAKLAEAVKRFFSRAQSHAYEKFPSTAQTTQEVKVLNNKEWLSGLNLLDFLRHTGVHFRVNHMLAKDSVRTRMTAKHGITFTEFTYQLLQAYDFYNLYNREACAIQVGGSDQWGNIVAGLELINKGELDDLDPKDSSQLEREKGFGITTPLLTTSQGDKFGKSAGNAVWLDVQMTSYFDFYQFFVRTADGDVSKYLKMFTLLPPARITEIMAQHQAQPEKRVAQRHLADEVTSMIHGKEGLDAARMATKVLFDSDYHSLKAEQIVKALRGDARLASVRAEELLGTSISHLAAAHSLLASKSDARRLVRAGGLYLNNKPIKDAFLNVSKADLIDGRVAILRAGKDKHLVLAIE